MTINTSASGSYRTTQCLNPSASWQERIDGNAVPVISLYCVEADAMYIMWDALRKAARKEENDTKAAELLLICAEIAKAWEDAKNDTEDYNRKALERLKAWKADQNESEAASC